MKASLSLLVWPLAALAAPMLDEKRTAAAKSINKLIQPYSKIYFGVATDKDRLVSSNNSNIVKADFGQVTPENSMKFAETEPSQNTFNFTDSDYLVDFAIANGKTIRGHNLVWHQGLPAWVTSITDNATLIAVMQNHITTVMTRYKGKIRAWDVCNEIFQDDGTLRPSVWYNVIGESFVSIAYKTARAADPSAVLYINDYSLDDPDNPKLTDGMVAHVTDWRAAGIPIDAIGSQTHLGPDQADNVGAALSALAQTGVDEVAITELDITNAVPDDYTTVTQACLNVDTCVGITVWGISDVDSYRAADKPLLFDWDYLAKPAYTAIATMLSDS